MAEYILSCCSTADLTEEHFLARGIRYNCFHYALGDQEYPDDLGKTIPFAEFYKRMEEGEMTRTSQINVEEFVNYFEPMLKEGKDVLHVTLSSGLSGVYNSAVAAAALLKEKYPERKLYVVDSLGAASGVGLFMDKLADLRDEGKSVTELYTWAEDHKLNVNYWFFSTDLKYYVRGGRISKASGFLGGLLKICPLLNMDDLGKLVPRSKVRGLKKVSEEIVKRMEEWAENGLEYADKCYVSHSAFEAEARAVADTIEARFPKLKGKVELYNIGTTIGSHTGPGTVAVFFWGKKRTR